MFKYFERLKLQKKMKEDMKVMSDAISKLKNTKFSENFLTNYAEDGGDFSYSHTIFFYFDKKQFTIDDLRNNIKVKGVNIKYTEIFENLRVDISKKKYYSDIGIRRTIEFEALCESLQYKYKQLSEEQKMQFANNYMESMYKLLSFMKQFDIYTIKEDDYDLVKVALSLLITNIEGDFKVNTNNVRDELMMEIKYLNKVRENNQSVEEMFN